MINNIYKNFIYIYLLSYLFSITKYYFFRRNLYIYIYNNIRKGFKFILKTLFFNYFF